MNLSFFCQIESFTHIFTAMNTNKCLYFNFQSSVNVMHVLMTFVFEKHRRNLKAKRKLLLSLLSLSFVKEYNGGFSFLLHQRGYRSLLCFIVFSSLSSLCAVTMSILYRFLQREAVLQKVYVKCKQWKGVFFNTSLLIIIKIHK